MPRAARGQSLPKPSSGALDFEIRFRNLEQELFYFSAARNSCFSGGFGNGKTYVALQRAFTMLATFPGYRYAIARKTYKHLRTTTMETFLKICPLDSPFYLRHEPKDGYSIFANQSLIYWLHLDAFDEDSLRGLEINSVLIDQAEEIEEAIYLILDARVGRWDLAKAPDSLKTAYEKTSDKIWPQDDLERDRVPNRMDILVNPDSEFHWVYRRYHPDSEERKQDHFFIERETDPKMYDPGTYREMESREPEWVDRYLRGKWGASSSAIHYITKQSVIKTDSWTGEQLEEFLDILFSEGALYRVLDHGSSAPTCLGWFCAISNIHIWYKEYYVPNATISFHRQNIFDLTTDKEEILNNYADPAIFKKTAQKITTFWTVAEEYAEPDYTEAPPITFLPADNNEFSTRNRINESLGLQSRNIIPAKLIPFLNPGREEKSPAIFFIQRSKLHPQGCNYGISETNQQRKKLLGTDNGKPIYSDERDKAIADHAYDVLRYYIAAHSRGLTKKDNPPPKRSFARFNAILKQRKRYNKAPSRF